MQKIQSQVNSRQSSSWLIHFVDTEEDHDIEYRKLPAMLQGIKVSDIMDWSVLS